MANQKISAMTAASALGGTEKLAGVQSGANVVVTPAQINTYIGTAITAGKTLTVANSLTFKGTDGKTMTLPATSDTLAGLGTAQTFSAAQTFGSTIKVSGDTTGAGTALGFGTNSPATTLTGPFTWLKFISSDGSTVYVPAFK